MITFRRYYIDQFKEVPKVWKLAKKHKKYGAFFCNTYNFVQSHGNCDDVSIRYGKNKS